MMTETQSWVDKHRPERLSDVQGNNADIDTIKNWADEWSPGDEPVLLVGPPGTGKTSTAECVADRLDLQMVEINASDARDSESVKDLAVSIRSTGDAEMRLILIDEVDSWHHAVSKQPMYDALDSPANPVILTANDEYSIPSGITSRSNMLNFSLGVRSRKSKLREIAEAEDLDLDPHELKVLSNRPDLRSAINDLEAWAKGGEGDIGGDEREWEQDEFDVLDVLLTGTPDIGQMSPDDAVMWVNEVMSAEYRGLEMSMGYEALSRADVQLGEAQSGDYGRWAYAAQMVEEVARIRQTRPYFGDEVSYKNKSFPEWFRHSASSPSDASDEAKTYNALKSPDEAGMTMAGNYQEFRRVHLKKLKSLDPEEKHRFILNHRLEPEEYAALDITQSEHEEWVELEDPELGEWTPDVQDASQW